MCIIYCTSCTMCCPFILCILFTFVLFEKKMFCLAFSFDFLFLLFFISSAGMDPKASCMLGKVTTTQLHPQTYNL